MGWRLDNFLEAAGGSNNASTSGDVTDYYINIPSNATDVSVAQDGSVSFIPPAGYTPLAGQATQNGRVVAGYLSLAKFPNEPGMERVANGFIIRRDG